MSPTNDSVRFSWRGFLAAVLLTLAMVWPAGAVEPKPTVKAQLNLSALQPGQQAVIAVITDIPAGLHAQPHAPKDPTLADVAFQVVLDKNELIKPLTFQYPAPTEHKQDEVYKGRVVVYVPFTLSATATPGALKLAGRIQAQMCDDEGGSCYPPGDVPFAVETTIVAAGQAVTPQNGELFKNFDPTVFSQQPPTPNPPSGPKASTQAPPAKDDAAFEFLGLTVGKNSYAIALLAALLVGLIFNVMPCVLPVLPLKAMGFYQVSQHNRIKSFALGSIFSLGIVVTFGFLGALVLIFSVAWGELFSYAWFVWGVVVILLLMAAGQFGLFTFQLPLGVYRFEPRHDTYSGNFLFGILTAILSTPCTAPIFPPLLIWAGKQPPAIGVAFITLVGVGMALPYLILSAMPEVARKLPRTGHWSVLIKEMMGFLILGVAGYFVGIRLLHGAQFIWIVFGVAIAAGVFLIARTAQFMHRARPIAIAGLIAVILGGSTLALAMRLTRDAGPQWTAYSDAALAKAVADKRIVLVKFTASWCANCQYVEATVFPDPNTLAALKRYDVYLLKADLTDKQAAGWSKLREISSSGGIPLTVIYSPHLREPITLASIYTTPTLVNALTQAGGGLN